MTFSVIRLCKSCSAKNRVPARHLADADRCGVCKERMCCKWLEWRAGSLKGPPNGDPTSDLQLAADRAGPYSLRRPLVLAVLAVAARHRRAARRAWAASRPYDGVALGAAVRSRTGAAPTAAGFLPAL